MASASDHRRPGAVLRVGSRPDQLIKNVCVPSWFARLVADIAERPFWDRCRRRYVAARPVGPPPPGAQIGMKLVPVDKEHAISAEQHSHEAQVHQHEHTHVTHYLRHGEEWAHLPPTMTTSTITPPDHSHQPHEDPAKEHQREAHVHDHEQPAPSPA
jgi:hypothetical protein